MSATAIESDVALTRDSQLENAFDARLLIAVSEGDEAAFGRLQDRFKRSVERVCRTLPGEVEDCVQEVFLRVWRKAHLFDPERGSATAWLLTLARNVTHNLRTLNRTQPLELAPEPASSTSSEVEHIWLVDALAQLPESERTVIELAYFKDHSQSQIAADLGVPLGTVKSWNRRALNRLASLLEESGQ